jgi:hypothetical protein
MNAKLGEIADLSQTLGGTAHAEAVCDLGAYLEDTSLRVVVFGEFSVGKSTLINALFGRAALPAKAMPTTGHATRIRYGNPEAVLVRFTDGRSQSCPLAQIGSFVTLDLQSRAREGIEAIEVAVDVPLLRDGLVLIDTPGVNDAEAQTRRAERAVMGADLVLLVLRANQMLGAEIRQRAAGWMVRELGKPVVPVLNGLNEVEEEDRSELRRLLRAWARAALEPVLGRPFFEVNAIGALRHALGIAATPRPDDDFSTLKAALEGLTGRTRQDLQAATRRRQARTVLRGTADCNRRELDQLEHSAQALTRRRDERRRRLQRSAAALGRRLSAEMGLLQGLATSELQEGFNRLARSLEGKDKDELERKARPWFETFLGEAVRTAERRASERLLALADELSAPVPEPLTVAQLVALSQRTEVHINAPDNTNAVGAGAWGGAAAGALIGSAVPVIGTILGGVIGFIAGSIIADRATHQEPDYVGAYTSAARADWDEATAAIRESLGAQYQARVDEMLRCLREQISGLARIPSASHELRSRQRLQNLLDGALHEIEHWSPGLARAGVHERLAT